MKFEHLVEINSLADSGVVALGREELWFGLLCRAEDARPFLPGLDRCHIVERRGDELVRELHFGATVIRDRVRLWPLERIRFESDPTPEHAGGSLTVTIEEIDGALFLRFCYATNLAGADGEEAEYAEIVRAAYYQSDFDTLKVIRELAVGGVIH